MSKCSQPFIIGPTTVGLSTRVLRRSYNGPCRRLWTLHRDAGKQSWPTYRPARSSSSSSSINALSTSNISAPPEQSDVLPPPSKPRQKPHTCRDYLDVADNALADRWETDEPTAAQLRYADLFFQAQPPGFMYSAAKFRTIDFAGAPEVAFLGRSNVGKSSLLNALLGRKICHTSGKPGRTKTMNAFSVNGGQLVVLDMPGYGKGSRAEWGREILKYLSERKALRRAFLLIDALHGVKASDAQLLAIFRENAIPHQIILSKVDRILCPTSRIPAPAALQLKVDKLKRKMVDLRTVVQPRNKRHPPALGEILTCSAAKNVDERGRKLGVSGIRWAMLVAAGLETGTVDDLRRRARTPNVTSWRPRSV